MKLGTLGEVTSGVGGVTLPPLPTIGATTVTSAGLIGHWNVGDPSTVTDAAGNILRLTDLSGQSADLVPSSLVYAPKLAQRGVVAVAETPGIDAATYMVSAAPGVTQSVLTTGFTVIYWGDRPIVSDLVQGMVSPSERYIVVGQPGSLSVFYNPRQGGNVLSLLGSAVITQTYTKQFHPRGRGVGMYAASGSRLVQNTDIWLAFSEPLAANALQFTRFRYTNLSTSPVTWSPGISIASFNGNGGAAQLPLLTVPLSFSEVFVFDRQLTTTELAAHYTANRARYNL